MVALLSWTNSFTKNSAVIEICSIGTYSYIEHDIVTRFWDKMDQIHINPFQSLFNNEVILKIQILNLPRKFHLNDQKR